MLKTVFGKFLIDWSIMAALFVFLLASTPAELAAARDFFVFDGSYEIGFEIPPNLVGSVHNPSGAVGVLEQVLGSLTDELKADKNVVESLTRLTELLVRQSVQADISEDSPLTIGLVRSLASEANFVMRALTLLAENYGVEFLRELRAGVSFNFEGDVSVIFEHGINAAGVAQFSLNAPFASLLVNVPNISDAVEISLTQYPIVLHVNAAEYFKRYWGVGVSSMLLLLWLLAILVAKKRIWWWMPVLACAAVLGGNLILVGFPSPLDDTARDDSFYSVRFMGLDSVVLIVPIDDPRPNEYVLFDASGRPTLSRYNGFTKTINAKIFYGGDFSLNLAPVYFADLGGKSNEMRQAIHMLTARGVMAGSGDGVFLPDRKITVAEFFYEVLLMLNLFDENAENVFVDVLPGDWFYIVAASAHRAGLTEGFGSEFMGNMAITRKQAATVASNTLKLFAGYPSGSAMHDFIDMHALPNAQMTRGEAAIVLYRIFFLLT